MALAETLHHSAQKVMEEHTALRGPKKASAGEEVVNELHYALREPTTPPPGERLGCLVDPGLQRSDRTVRRSAGDGLPTLGLPVLAGASGEAVDDSTLAFLTRVTLEERRKDEVEKAKEKEKQKAATAKELVVMPRVGEWVELVDDTGETYYFNPQLGVTRWTMPGSSSSSSTRKRKKKKRRRKPRRRRRTTRT